MLSPKRTKYRKFHRGRMRGTASKGNVVCFGKYGLQALEPTWITSRQIELLVDIPNEEHLYGFVYSRTRV